MRELKFRAWDEMSNIMHYDFQFIKSGNEGVDWIVFTSDKHPLNDSIKDPFKDPHFQYAFKIMQYTNSKDKNGREIYDGDIVKDLGENIGKCFWNDNSSGFDIDFTAGEMQSVYEASNSIEIVGNIYENPELLENK